MESGRTVAAGKSLSSDASIVRWPCSRISFSMNNEYKTSPDRARSEEQNLPRIDADERGSKKIHPSGIMCDCSDSPERREGTGKQKRSTLRCSFCFGREERTT